MKTIAKNTKKFRQVLENAKSITVYTLDNCFDGQPVEKISEQRIASGKMVQKSESQFTLHIHSNCWYKIEAA